MVRLVESLAAAGCSSTFRSRRTSRPCRRSSRCRCAARHGARSSRSAGDPAWREGTSTGSPVGVDVVEIPAAAAGGSFDPGGSVGLPHNTSPRNRILPLAVGLDRDVGDGVFPELRAVDRRERRRRHRDVAVAHQRVDPGPAVQVDVGGAGVDMRSQPDRGRAASGRRSRWSPSRSRRPAARCEIVPPGLRTSTVTAPPVTRCCAVMLPSAVSVIGPEPVGMIVPSHLHDRRRGGPGPIAMPPAPAVRTTGPSLVTRSLLTSDRVAGVDAGGCRGPHRRGRRSAAHVDRVGGRQLRVRA